MISVAIPVSFYVLLLHENSPRKSNFISVLLIVMLPLNLAHKMLDELGGESHVKI